MKHLPLSILSLKLREVLLVGTLIRLFLAPFLAHPFDIYAWYNNYLHIVEGSSAHVSFPPMWYYTMMPVAYLYFFLSHAFSINPIPIGSIPPELNPGPEWAITLVPGFLFNTVIKIPLIISDMIVAILLYDLVVELTGRKQVADKAAFLWFLNPHLIWISSAWGQIDTLPVLFALASLYLLIKRRTVLSGVCLAISFAYKLYPILFLFPVAFYVVKKNPFTDRGTVAIFCTSFIGASAVLFAPVISKALSFTGSFLQGSNAGSLGEGLSYWSILLMIPLNAEFAYAASASIGLFLLAFIMFRVSRLDFKDSSLDLVRGQLACILAIFLSVRFVEPQHFVWALPFIIILVVQGHVEESLYKGASLLALLYSVTSCLPPFYMLPLAPYIGGTLAQIVSFIRPLRARPTGNGGTLTFIPQVNFGSVFLFSLGTLFSILMFILLVEVLYRRGRICGLLARTQ